MLPLDLHVLGLSLAFILSQDQTLRCIKIICIDLVNYFYNYYSLQEPYSKNHSVIFPFVHSNIFKERR